MNTQKTSENGQKEVTHILLLTGKLSSSNNTS